MSFSAAPAAVLGAAFHYLDWPELHATLQCNRLCYAVVCNSMRSIQRSWALPVCNARQPVDRLPLVLASPLAARHMGHLLRVNAISGQQLAVLADRFTRLQTLRIGLTLPSPAASKSKVKSTPLAYSLDPALRFPASLTNLDLKLVGTRPLNNKEATLISHAIARCVDLQLLSLCVVCRIPLAPLAAALPRLGMLHLPMSCLFAEQTTGEQATAIRSLPSLTELHLDSIGNPQREQRLEQLRRITADPCSLQLQLLDLGNSSLCDDLAECLTRLPTLQAFECSGFATITQLHFLRSLPQLTSLQLMWMPPTTVTPDAIVTALQPLSQLRTLALSLVPGMRSVHLAAILGGMPQLTSLSLPHFGPDPAWLDSLRFLSDAASALQCLDHLQLCRHHNGPPHLDSSELLHVLACKSLSDLRMLNVFALPLDEALRNRIEPGCAELPLLSWRIIEDM